MHPFKRMLLFLTVAALILSLAACGQPEQETTIPTSTTAPTESSTGPTEDPNAITAAEILSQTSSAMSQDLTTSYHLSASFQLRCVTEDGTENRFGYRLESGIIFSETPFGRFNGSRLSISDGDQFRSYAVRQYDLEENGTVVTYFHRDTDGVWTVTDSGLDPAAYAGAVGSSIYTGEVWPGAGAIDSLSVDLTPVEYEGIPVYALHGTLPMRHFTSITEAFSLTENEALMTLSIPVTWYVDTQTFAIVMAEADLSPAAELLLAELTAELDEAQRDTAALTAATLVYTLGTGIQTIPELPPEARETETCKALVADAGYVYIHLTSEWTFADHQPNSITVKRKEATATVRYLEGETDAYFRSKAADHIARMKELSLYSSYYELEPVNGFSVIQVNTSGTTYYFLWQEIGSGAVYMEVSDYYFDGTTQELLALLTAAITEIP